MDANGYYLVNVSEDASVQEQEDYRKRIIAEEQAYVAPANLDYGVLAITESNALDVDSVVTLSNQKRQIRYRNHQKQRYACYICGVTFSAPWSLQVHHRIHTGEKPFKCTHCSKAFITKSLCDNHVRLHTGEKPYQCKTCDQSFRTAANLRNHRVTHTGIKPFLCKGCNVRFRYYISLQDHLHSEDHAKVTGTDDNPYVCQDCGQIYRSGANLRNHNKKHHGVGSVGGDATENLYKCEACDLVYRSKFGLQCHLRGKRHAATVNIPFNEFARIKKENRTEKKCDVCSVSFLSYQHLYQHKKSKTHLLNVYKQVEGALPNAWEKNISCKMCDLEFDNRGAYIQHTDSEHGTVHQFFCQICLEYFPERCDYRAHNEQFHGDIYKFKCTVCGRLHKSDQEMKRHMVIHTNEKTYLCNYCGNGYLTATRLNSHMKKCAGTRSFKCEICGLVLAYKSNLKTHMVTHNSVYLFKCKDCKCSFKTKAQWQKHSRNHLPANLRPYPCTLCDWSFNKLVSLKIHQTKYHPVVYTCANCHIFRENVSELFCHMQTDHGIDSPLMCEICLLFCPTIDDLREHEVSHTLTECSGNCCQICGQVFSNWRVLIKHEEIHESIRRIDAAISEDQSNSVFEPSNKVEVTEFGVSIGDMNDISLDDIAGTSQLDCSTITQITDCTTVNSKLPLNVEIDEVITQDQIIGETDKLSSICHADSDQVYECTECKVVMVNNPNMIRIHAKLHVEAMPYMCDICNQMFLWKVMLMNHQMTHRRPRRVGKSKVVESEICKTRGQRKRRKCTLMSRRIKMKKNSSRTIDSPTFSAQKGQQDAAVSNQCKKTVSFSDGSGSRSSRREKTINNYIGLASSDSSDFDSNEGDFTDIDMRAEDFADIEMKVEDIADNCDMSITGDVNGRAVDTIRKPSLRKVLSSVKNGKNPNPKAFICEHCGAKFALLKRMQVHIRRCVSVTPEKDTKPCGMCSKQIGDSELVPHKLQHFKGKDAVKCRLCKGSFKLVSEMDNMLIIHTKDKSMMERIKNAISNQMFLEETKNVNVVSISTQTDQV